MSSQQGSSSTKCSFSTKIRLTGISPFKAPTYKDSMYKNYKCEINYDIVPASPDTVKFIRRLVIKNPQERMTATEALENDLFLSIEFDENPYSHQNLLNQLREMQMQAR